MHCPLLAPVQGMPSICGTSGLPAMLQKGELGTVCGTQTPVYMSDSSPAGQAASGEVGAAEGPANAATAGAAATASANPPAMISRRAEISKIAIVTLSVVIDRVVGWILWKLNEICTASSSSLTTRRVKLPRTAGCGRGGNYPFAAARRRRGRSGCCPPTTSEGRTAVRPPPVRCTRRNCRRCRGSR